MQVSQVRLKRKNVSEYQTHLNLLEKHVFDNHSDYEPSLHNNYPNESQTSVVFYLFTEMQFWQILHGRIRSDGSRIIDFLYFISLQSPPCVVTAVLKLDSSIFSYKLTEQQCNLTFRKKHCHVYGQN